MLGNHKSIDMSQSTPYAQEMRQWEAYPTKFGPAGRPYQFRQFPKRMYLAGRPEGKGAEIVEARTVHDEHEERNLLSRGFRFGQDTALEAWAKEETEHAKLAAERNYEIAHGRISPAAAGEVRAAEHEHGARHLPEVAAAPVKKRGRPFKVLAE